LSLFYLSLEKGTISIIIFGLVWLKGCSKMQPFLCIVFSFRIKRKHSMLKCEYYNLLKELYNSLNTLITTFITYTILFKMQFKTKDTTKLLSATFTSWNDKDPFRQSAVIAYYAIFSIPGL
jgi:membrane protein